MAAATVGVVVGVMEGVKGAAVGAAVVAGAAVGAGVAAAPVGDGVTNTGAVVGVAVAATRWLAWHGMSERSQLTSSARKQALREDG